MATAPGISFRIYDFDTLRSQIDLIPGVQPIAAELAALDEWRDSLGLPRFPTTDEASGVTSQMTEDATECLERMVAILVFGVQSLEAAAFVPLVRLAVALDQSDPWTPPPMITGDGLACRSRLGLLAVTSGAVAVSG